MKLRGVAAVAAVAAASGAEALAEDITIDPVIVYGASRDARDLFEVPVPVSVVGEAELLRLQPQTYEDLLGDIPGVLIFGGPRGISHEPNIRGFADEQIVLRFDGARQNFDLAHRGRFFTDPEILRRVEVIRGGASTLFGSGALGGVIMLETADAEDFVDPGEIWGGRIKVGFSSQGASILTAATVGAVVDEFDALAFVSWRPMGEDLEDGSGTAIRDSEIDAVTGLVKLGYEPTEGTRFEFAYQFYDDEGVTPPNSNAGGSTTTSVDRSLSYQSARLEWSWAPPDSEFLDLTVLAYFNHADVTEDRIFDGRFDQTEYTTFGFEAVNRTRLDLGVPVALSYGIEGYRDEQEATRDGAPRPQAPDATATFLAAFVQADIDITPEWTLTPGLRLDHFELDPDGALPDRSETQLSPRVALTWRPDDDLRLWLSAAQSFRAPSLTELYNDGIHFDTGAGFPLGPGTVFTGRNEFIPNPNLEPELSRQIELGARYRMRDAMFAGDSLTISGNTYYARVDDFIDQVVTFIDFGTGVFNPITGQFEVSGSTTGRNIDAELWGFEGELVYDAGIWFTSAALSVNRGHAREGGALGSIPADRVVLTFGYRPDDDLELGFRTNLVDGVNNVPAGGLQTGGYVTFDIFATWLPTDGMFGGATFAAGVDNLTDREYRIHPNGLNQPGRTFKVSAAWDF